MSFVFWSEILLFLPPGVCVVGGHAWWECVCVAGGVYGGGHVWQGGMHGRGCA